VTPTAAGLLQTSPLAQASLWTVPLEEQDGVRASTGFYVRPAVQGGPCVGRTRAYEEYRTTASWLFTAGHCVLAGAVYVRTGRYSTHLGSNVLANGTYMGDAGAVVIAEVPRTYPELRLDTPEVGERLYVHGYGGRVLRDLVCRVVAYEDDGKLHFSCDEHVIGGFSGSPVMDAQGRVVGVLTHCDGYYCGYFPTHEGAATLVCYVVEDLRRYRQPFDEPRRVWPEGPDY
jgi:hypothetical protein